MIDFVLTALIVLGALIVAAKKATQDQYGSAVGSLVGGAVLAFAVHYLPDLMGSSDTKGSNTAAVPAADPPAAATTTPMTGSGATDWSPLVWVLAVVVGVIAVAGGIAAARVVHRRHRAAKQRRTNRAADHELARQQWDRAIQRHNALRTDFLAVESDPMSRLTMPTFWDPTRPASKDWWDAHGEAENRRLEAMPTDPTWRQQYIDAVSRADRAFRHAQFEARSVGLTRLGDGERRRVLRAQRALAIVLDDAATDAERRLAYATVQECIAGLIDLPKVMHDSLTSRTHRELPPSPTLHPTPARIDQR